MEVGPRAAGVLAAPPRASPPRPPNSYSPLRRPLRPLRHPCQRRIPKARSLIFDFCKLRGRSLRRNMRPPRPRSWRRGTKQAAWSSTPPSRLKSPRSLPPCPPCPASAGLGRSFSHSTRSCRAAPCRAFAPPLSSPEARAFALCARSRQHVGASEGGTRGEKGPPRGFRSARDWARQHLCTSGASLLGESASFSPSFSDPPSLLSTPRIGRSDG